MCSLPGVCTCVGGFEAPKRCVTDSVSYAEIVAASTCVAEMMYHLLLIDGGLIWGPLLEGVFSSQLFLTL